MLQIEYKLEELSAPDLKPLYDQSLVFDNMKHFQSSHAAQVVLDDLQNNEQQQAVMTEQLLGRCWALLHEAHDDRFVASMIGLAVENERLRQRIVEKKLPTQHQLEHSKYRSDILMAKYSWQRRSTSSLVEDNQQLSELLKQLKLTSATEKTALLAEVEELRAFTNEMHTQQQQHWAPDEAIIAAHERELADLKAKLRAAQKARDIAENDLCKKVKKSRG
jgi:hypothetical protein